MGNFLRTTMNVPIVSCDLLSHAMCSNRSQLAFLQSFKRQSLNILQKCQIEVTTWCVEINGLGICCRLIFRLQVKVNLFWYKVLFCSFSAGYIWFIVKGMHTRTDTVKFKGLLKQLKDCGLTLYFVAEYFIGGSVKLSLFHLHSRSLNSSSQA